MIKPYDWTTIFGQCGDQVDMIRNHPCQKSIISVECGGQACEIRQPKLGFVRLTRSQLTRGQQGLFYFRQKQGH